MKIQQITEKKEKYLDILLLADPQEDMIERYLEDGEMYILTEDNVVKTVCVVLMLDNRECELKNIATIEEERGKGYGRQMIRFICEHYSRSCDFLYVGTGDSKRSLDFYESNGFVYSHIVENFFVDNYDEAIYDDDILLTNMVYLKKELHSEVDVKKVLDMALEAGRILLKNGAEIFRVEETITRICNSFHVDKVDIFTLSHAIFVTACTDEDNTYTKVKNVPLSGAHLGIVAEVNDLSRKISAGRISLDEASERLQEIEKIPPEKTMMQILGAGMESGCCGFLMGGTAAESMLAFIVGAMLQVWVFISGRIRVSRIMTNIIGGVLIVLMVILAQHMMVFETVRVERIMAGALMPLVPGVKVVNAIRDFADSDFLSGTVRLLDAILVFVCIAIGAAVAFGFYGTVLGGAVL